MFREKLSIGCFCRSVVMISIEKSKPQKRIVGFAKQISALVVQSGMDTTFPQKWATRKVLTRCTSDLVHNKQLFVVVQFSFLASLGDGMRAATS
jgi:hypothetical protein